MVWARRQLIFSLLGLMLLVGLGCQAKNPTSSEVMDTGIFQDHSVGLVPSEPADNYDFGDPVFNSEPLKDFNFNSAENFRRVSLDDVIQSALGNSQVVRDLGGTVLQTPDLIRSAQDPALVYTDPAQGEEAALSAFDAQLSSQFLYQNVDRGFNSTFVGDQGIFRQDLLTHNLGLSKRSATGASYRLDGNLVYDRNNTISNQFADDTAYDTFLQAEIRQPLLQGAGVNFNRIAGPNNLPGVNNGVLIARANTDIGLAEFEIAMRNLVSDVENAYWDLYFAYRDLEAKIEARNGAYQIWQRLKNNNKGASEIAQAKEQYYRFAGDVQDAIHGRLNDGTRTNNGSASGTFRANGGVRVAERRLRLIAGLPLNDTQLIVPADMPVEAQVIFDWMQAKDDALINRTELRRQRWVIKRECLELTANRNFLLPRVDLVSRYRLRGFGNDLYGSNGFDVASAGAGQDGTDALATMLNGDFQEWELGFDVNIPIGFRRENAAVRNSLLSIKRERTILKEQQRQVVYGLSNAMGELDRTMGLLEINRNRLDASEKQFEVIKNEQENDRTTIDLVLESQRRVIDSKRSYFQTQVEFMLAVKSVHFEKGTLLGYHNVALTETGWENQEYEQAQRRETMKSAPLNFAIPGLHVGNPKSETNIAGQVIGGAVPGDIAPNAVGGEVFEVADTETEEGQLRFADASRFLSKFEDGETEIGMLRSMALEVDEEEKAKERAKKPFKSFFDRMSKAGEERELNKTLDEKPIFDTRKLKAASSRTGFKSAKSPALSSKSSASGETGLNPNPTALSSTTSKTTTGPIPNALIPNAPNSATPNSTVPDSKLANPSQAVVGTGVKESNGNPLDSASKSLTFGDKPGQAISQPLTPMNLPTTRFSETTRFGDTRRIQTPVVTRLGSSELPNPNSLSPISTKPGLQNRKLTPGLAKRDVKPNGNGIANANDWQPVTESNATSTVEQANVGNSNSKLTQVSGTSRRSQAGSKRMAPIVRKLEKNLPQKNLPQKDSLLKKQDTLPKRIDLPAQEAKGRRLPAPKSSKEPVSKIEIKKTSIAKNLEAPATRTRPASAASSTNIKRTPLTDLNLLTPMMELKVRQRPSTSSPLKSPGASLTSKDLAPKKTAAKTRKNSSRRSGLTKSPENLSKSADDLHLSNRASEGKVEASTKSQTSPQPPASNEAERSASPKPASGSQKPAASSTSIPAETSPKSSRRSQ